MTAILCVGIAACGKEPTKAQRESGDTTSNAESETKSETASDASSLVVFEKRILPIFNAKRPSSCTECHLAGVDLKDYIHEDQAKTFASLVRSGLIDVDRPAKSKILEMSRKLSNCIMRIMPAEVKNMPSRKKLMVAVVCCVVCA